MLSLASTTSASVTFSGLIVALLLCGELDTSLLTERLLLLPPAPLPLADITTLLILDVIACLNHASS